MHNLDRLRTLRSQLMFSLQRIGPTGPHTYTSARRIEPQVPSSTFGMLLPSPCSISPATRPFTANNACQHGRTSEVCLFVTHYAVAGERGRRRRTTTAATTTATTTSSWVPYSFCPFVLVFFCECFWFWLGLLTKEKEARQKERKEGPQKEKRKATKERKEERKQERKKDRGRKKGRST